MLLFRMGDVTILLSLTRILVALALVRLSSVARCGVALGVWLVELEFDMVVVVHDCNKLRKCMVLVVFVESNDV